MRERNVFIETRVSFLSTFLLHFSFIFQGFRATAIQQLTLLAEETAKAQDKKLANVSASF